MPQPTWVESGGAWLEPGQVAAESLGAGPSPPPRPPPTPPTTYCPCGC